MRPEMRRSLQREARVWIAAILVGGVVFLLF